MKNVKRVNGMRRGILDHSVLLHEDRIVGIWMIKEGKVNGIARVRSEKMKEQQ